ncbi:MAG: alpha/beta fold hydrolase [Marivibrio sp.]|uniref:alpha/beta fold hydrolase n=1 Tax=Marivibrio sp. TaxID=2039719 RepID=UPI0032EDF7AC
MGEIARDREGEARLKSVRCAGRGGFHRVVYREFGPADSPHAVFCVHGLTRNGRDFARLARALAADGWRVICPDVAGRGESEPLVEAEHYGLPQYVSDLTTVLAHARVESVDWVGTSMGGLIALLTAATPGHPIRRLALNDVGPIVPREALQRIADYVGVAWRFESFDQALGHLKKAYAPFGLTEEADWREIAEVSLKRADDGSYSNNYDLRISEPFAALAGEDLDLWALWDAAQLAEPALLIRGAESDLLRRADAEAMTARGPGARLVEVPNVGHAPTLMPPDEIRLVRDWLAEAPAPDVRGEGGR